MDEVGTFTGWSIVTVLSERAWPNPPPRRNTQLARDGGRPFHSLRQPRVTLCRMSSLPVAQVLARPRFWANSLRWATQLSASPLAPLSPKGLLRENHRDQNLSLSPRRSCAAISKSTRSISKAVNGSSLIEAQWSPSRWCTRRHPLRARNSEVCSTHITFITKFSSCLRGRPSTLPIRSEINRFHKQSEYTASLSAGTAPVATPFTRYLGSQRLSARSMSSESFGSPAPPSRRTSLARCQCFDVHRISSATPASAPTWAVHSSGPGWIRCTP